MNVVVTGGAGYLGSVLIERLLRKQNVIVWDSLLYGVAGVVPYIRHPRFRLVRGDIRDFDWVGDYSPIVHLAALVGEPLCNKYPDLARDVNLHATMTIADYAQDANTHLIYASTCSNYGVSDGLATEESPLNPWGVYAETKVKAEDYIRRHVDYYTILRFPTLFGISPRTRFDVMVNAWVLDASLNGEICVYSPESYRPHLYVGDAARAIDHIIHAYRAFNEAFNIGAPANNLTKMQLATKIKAALPHTDIKQVDRGDKRNYRVDFTKFNNTFNFGEYQSVDYGIREVIEYLPHLETHHTNHFPRFS